MRDEEPIKELLASDDPADRVRGVHRAGVHPRRQAVPVLLEALSDPVEKVSGAAAMGLRDLATAEEMPVLVEEYLRPDRFSETYIYDIPYFYVLEDLGSADVWRPLVDAMEGATEREVVSRCVILLEMLRDLRARPPLERFCKEEDPGEDEVRAQAVRGAEKVLERLDEVADRISGVRTLANVRRALDADEYELQEAGEMGLEQWAREANRDELVNALSDSRNTISGAAAKALGVRGAAEAVPELVRQVSKKKRSIAAFVVQYPYSEETDLRESEHARALVRIDDRSAVEPLLDALETVDGPWVQWDILWILGWLGDPRALEPAEREMMRLNNLDSSGWRYRALVSNAKEAVARLQNASEPGE